MGIIKDTLYRISNKQFLKNFKNQSIFPYYHIVRDNQVAHIENLYQFKNCKQFLNDINILTTNYKPINPQDLLNNKNLKNNFLLSFDDGLEEVYTIIYPILKKNNLKAIFFINPNFVDNNEGLYKHYISIIVTHLKKNNFEKSTLDKISQKLSFTYNTIEEFKQKFINIKFSEREKIKDILVVLNIDIKTYLKEQHPYITKKQIQEMINDGFYFGGHTMTHPPLNQLTHEEQKKEIINSINWLKENFNINYSLFAFPFSDKSISKKLLNELFEYDSNIKLFGNSGLKKDIDKRIIQRFSLENPKKQTEKQIVTENLYKYFNKLIGKYNIKRK
ncbi:polysaccharide deacetylase family protein [Flavobacterium sp.]|jgi:peptidoglycan/xylan/chitin deacetylase (PgdA/CDA1 family)|uniref:polysaccharide deacetylase family protein n=1 Tax=Flavobacterium sp. TaxID=239 RepID=UPI0037BFCA70